MRGWRRGVFTLVLLMTAVCIVPGCKVRWHAEQYTWSVSAPKSVARGEHLEFRVETAANSGARAHGIAYYWAIDWVGLRASLHESGRTPNSHRIRVKGDAGTAQIRIMSYDSNGHLIEVAKQPFQVE